MKKRELLSIAFVLLAIALILSNIPGGHIVLIVSLGTLAVLYFPLGFLLFRTSGKQEDRTIGKHSASQTFLIILVGLALANICLGILFKVQHWMGAQPMFYFGIGLATILLLILVFQLLSKKQSQVKGMALRLTIAIAIGAWLALISPTSLVKLVYADYPRYMEAYEATINSPNDPMNSAKLELENHRIQLSDEDFKRFEEYWYIENYGAYPDSLNGEK